MGSDFRACFALHCETCGCEFCAWCFNLSQATTEATASRVNHLHVMQCALNPPTHRGGYYGTLADFNTVHSERRRKAVVSYISSDVAQEDKVPLQQSIFQDLQDLAITL